ncbi:mandelate racemase/muconate lactonizing enzyme family protein [Maritimibacter dapengensis]|uniref:Mandelate racemase/muconate lactonizing enzyme family protein n=1 Tax=Maritimibacter dapengensis TaxID=2836868 RepID=A0ABS6T0Y3_9RHOB|nr:mandelate racemase/muconate lactonizing enzyme family protein [Maritimibacter dapengensis]MBV7378883.1 mandelate racemase/muconate lactonizing enzyme family protein [Maritimibacter dapengensis]
MRIAELHLFTHDLPVKDGPYRIASGDVWSLTTTIVKLVTDTGVIGWGEACPVGPTYAEAHAKGALAALTELAPNLIGADVLPVPLHARMDSLLYGHNYAKSAIDIAAFDALGRSLNIPVCDLLGGALTNRVASYYSIGVCEPDEAARIAREKVAEGYPRLQIKLSGRPVEIDIAAMRKVCEALEGSGVKLAADGNRGWSTGDAIQFSRACSALPFVIEQPCNRVDDLRTVRPFLHHPLYMDENGRSLATTIEAAGTGLVDGFGMKVGRLGGLHPMRAFRDLCAARRLPHTCDDAWGGDIVSAACTQIGATVAPERMDGVWLAAPYVAQHYDPDAGIDIVGGHIALPTGPGLGVTPDETLFGPPVASF